MLNCLPSVPYEVGYKECSNRLVYTHWLKLGVEIQRIALKIEADVHNYTI